MWPSFITAIECDSASASLWSWVTYTVVIRRSRCRRFSSKRMAWRTFASTLISPARGRSRPAIERSVVVLPQPLGPSRVNSFPSGTSKLTSCAARTIWPRSLGYSVKRPSTFSTRFSGSLLDSEFPAQPLGEHHQDEERQDEQHAERRQLHVLAVLPQFPDGDRQDLGARAVEQDRAGGLADRDDHHIDPARDQPRLQERQDDAAKRGAPGGAAHRRRSLRLLVDLQHQ